MEEDIEIKSLKVTSELIKKNYTFGKSAMKDLARDIDKTLYKLEQLEEENKHYKKYAVMMTTEGLLINGVKFSFNDYIPKSKVKEKIEEYKKNIDIAQGEELLILDSKVDVLQELLREE